jgi:hypothetical protein
MSYHFVYSFIIKGKQPMLGPGYTPHRRYDTRGIKKSLKLMQWPKVKGQKDKQLFTKQYTEN